MKQAHQTFIIEMIKHGDKTLAYQKAYPKCTDSESARKSAERLLRHHPDIVAEVEEATAHIRQRAYTEAYRLHTEQQKVKLLSMMDRREILARIARCEVKVCRHVKDTNGYRMLFEDPHPRDIIRAVEVDTRMEDICNRARNLTDPKLAQFNIYIDGRPCDDPTAPVNPDLPPGIIMLPRTRKKITGEQGNKMEQKTEAPLLFLGGENGEAPPGVSHSGVVNSCRTLASEENPDEEQGIKPEQNTEHCSPLGGDRGAFALENSPLYPQYLALYQQRRLQAEDLLAASFYMQDKQAIASAPPPHILTREEVRQLHAEADRKQERKHNKQPYNTFGKMYFPPERS